MKNAIVILFLFAFIDAFSQSSTFQALINLNHNVDNNRFILESKPAKDDFAEKKNIIWANVYFRYFKNPNIRSSQRPDESMKFSVRSQFLYRLYCTNDSLITIQLEKGFNDKLIDVDVSLFLSEGDKVNGTKVRSKHYTLTKDGIKIELQISEGVVRPGAFLHVLVETESFNFRTLGPFNFTGPIPGDYDLILSVNIPEAFDYALPSGLELLDKLTAKIKLKEFTYRNPPIIDYDAASYSYRWRVAPANSGKEIALVLQSINFIKDIGTSVEQVMEISQ